MQYISSFGFPSATLYGLEDYEINCDLEALGLPYTTSSQGSDGISILGSLSTKKIDSKSKTESLSTPHFDPRINIVMDSESIPIFSQSKKNIEFSDNQIPSLNNQPPVLVNSLCNIMNLKDQISKKM